MAPIRVSRSFAFVALIVPAVLAGQTRASVASTTEKIHLIGRVLPRAEVLLSQLSIGLSQNPAFASTGFALGNVSFWGNGRKFLVSLVSQNAEQTGQTALIDPDTGAAIGYRLRYGGATVKFESGQARVESVGVGRSADPKPLDVDIPAGADPTRGHFQDHLTIVVTAR